MSKTEELAILWGQSQGAIAAFIASLVPNFQDVSDILQNVAVITVKKFDEFDREKSFLAWAIGIARNQVLKYYTEKNKNRTILDIDAVKQAASVCETELLMKTSYEKDVKSALALCIERLKGKWKRILEMYYRDQKPDQIASELGITKNNVFVLLHRIRLALKECVNQQIGPSKI